MKSTAGHINEFKRVSSSWKEVFKWKATTLIAIKDAGRIDLLAGRISYFSIKPTINPLALETDNIIAAMEMEEVGADTFDERVNDACCGKFNISGRECKLFLKQGAVMNAAYFPIALRPSEGTLRTPSLMLYGSSRQDLFAKGRFLTEVAIGDELRSFDKPFDGLDDLLMYFGFPVLRLLPEACFLEFILDSPAVIHTDSKIKEGNAHVKCILGKTAESNKLKFGYKVLFKDRIERGCVEGGVFSWDDEDNFRTGTTSIAVSDATLLQGFLSYKGIPVNQWWIDDPEKRPNLRHAIHSMQDQDLGHIKKFLLSEEGKQNRSFEHGVAWLLNILGFSVVHFGKLSNMQDGPDIIAFTPQNNVVIVECTTGLLDKNDKLSKLVERSASIAEALKTSGNGYCKVQPIIVTAFSKNQVEADFPKAGENGIAVICKEDIEALLNRVKSPQNADSLFQESLQYIPVSKQVPLNLETNS